MLEDQVGTAVNFSNLQGGGIVVRDDKSHNLKKYLGSQISKSHCHKLYLRLKGQENGF